MTATGAWVLSRLGSNWLVSRLGPKRKNICTRGLR